MEVMREFGVSTATLDRWRQDAQPRPTQGRAWAAAARLKPVITTAALDEAGKSAWCRKHRVLRKDRALAETAALLVLSKELEAIFHKGGDE